MITLTTNKSNIIVDDDRREVRQSEQGLILPVVIEDADGHGYDLTDKVVQFNENKEGGKVVVDQENVTIVDATSGKLNYQLQEQVYAASGTCYFSIKNDSEDIVDTTKDFYIDVIPAAEVHINNDNYISSTGAYLDSLKATAKHAAEKETEFETKYQALLTKFGDDSESELSQKLIDLQTDYDKWKTTTVNDFNNKIKTVNDSIDLINEVTDDNKKAVEQMQAAVNQAEADFKSIDFTNFVNKNDVYDKATVDSLLKQAGTVKTASINDGVKVSPDETGNLSLKVPNPDLSTYATKTDALNINSRIDAQQVDIDNLKKNGSPIVVLTQKEYDALTTKDPTKIYAITDS